MKPSVISVNVSEQAPRRGIILAVPTLGMFSAQWMVGIQSLRVPMNLPIFQFLEIGKEVGQARNALVARALAHIDPKKGTRSSHIFFVDDDCLIGPSALCALWEHHKPIVGGLYYAKTEIPQPLVLKGRLEGLVDFTHGDVVECYAHGMGATLIDLEVFRTMYTGGHVETGEDTCAVCLGAKTVQVDATIQATCDGCFGTGKEIRWFHTTPSTLEVSGGVAGFMSQTEDVYFCERAAKAGYQPTVDTGVFAFHYQSPPIHYDDDRVLSGVCYPLEQWAEFQRTKRMTWPQAVAVPA